MPVSPRPRAPGIAGAPWLVLAAGILSGCAPGALRPPAAPTVPPAPVPPEPVAVPAEPAATAPPAPHAEQPPHEAADDDPWRRLRAGLRFADCGAADPAVAAERARLLRDPAALRRQFDEVLPQLAFVLQAVEARALPTEFALLPLVESGYRALPATGNRPAGPWQFMPATARDHGLRIDAARDARLDLAESTAAALALLARLGAAFDGDWSLATMAFNTGEFRLRRARAAQPGAPAGALRVGRITRTHLARLRALSCIVADPPAADDVLPPWDPGRALVARPVSAGFPLAEAARWTGLDPDALRRLNPARREARIGAGDRLLLPATAAPAFDAALARWTAAGGDDGAEHVVRAGESLWTIARRHGTTVRELARRNRIDPSRPLRPGQLLLLPR